MNRFKVKLGDVKTPKETRYNNLSLKDKLLFKKHNKTFGFNTRNLAIVKNGHYKKIIHLRFDLIGQYYDGDFKEHPSEVINKLGIKYMFWIPQTIADQIWLLGCYSVQKELPSYITELKLTQEQFENYTSSL